MSQQCVSYIYFPNSLRELPSGPSLDPTIYFRGFTEDTTGEKRGRSKRQRTEVDLQQSITKSSNLKVGAKPFTPLHPQQDYSPQMKYEASGGSEEKYRTPNKRGEEVFTNREVVWRSEERYMSMSSMKMNSPKETLSAISSPGEFWAPLSQYPVMMPPLNLDQVDNININTHNGVENDPKYRTELCKNWILTGQCKFGNRCIFAHGEEELRKKMHLTENFKSRLCQVFHKKGYCAYGTRCQFLHTHINVDRKYQKSYVNLIRTNINYVNKVIKETQNNEELLKYINIHPRHRLPIFLKISKSK